MASHKFGIAIIFFAFVVLAMSAPAWSSVCMWPQFFLKVEVSDIGVETITRADGSMYSRNYIELMVLEITEGSTSQMKVGGVYKTELSPKHSSLFKKGDKLIVGVEIGSSMGAAGPVQFIIWSPINAENGATIIDRFN